MAISVLFTGVAIAAVLGVVGYRIFRDGGGSQKIPEATVELPAGARIVGASMTDERIAVTIEVEGQTELRLYDAQTLEPRGRLRLGTKP